MQNTIRKSILLAQLCDSAFPIGSFAFSNGVESAVENNLIKDKADLKQYARTTVIQALYSDYLAALIAFRAAYGNNYKEILEADNISYIGKLSNESRGMSIKMGRKCAEMATLLFPQNRIVMQWHNDIIEGKCYGCHNISLAIMFRAAGMDEASLFAALEYGTINMVLNAALRIFRVSHIDTQQILKELCALASEDYEKIKELDLQDIQSFAPELDIIASLHEQGTKRMFGN
ncbi:MAG: urease accessory protein UreF [Odoribacter sp.]|nr:urease accessory protein UreF [Odoribacter sp.]